MEQANLPDGGEGGDNIISSMGYIKSLMGMTYVYIKYTYNTYISIRYISVLTYIRYFAANLCEMIPRLSRLKYCFYPYDWVQ